MAFINSNLTTSADGYLISFFKITIASYNHFREPGGNHAIARALTIRHIADAVDANLAGVVRTSPRKASFNEWFAQGAPYLILYFFLRIWDVDERGFRGERCIRRAVIFFVAFFIFEFVDSYRPIMLLEQQFAAELNQLLTNVFEITRAQSDAFNDIVFSGNITGA